MMEPGENIDDYIERRIAEATADIKVYDIQQLPLAALRRWNEAQYLEFENDTPLETRLPMLTALPQSPQEGQVISYDAGDGLTWRFRYNNGSTSAYKWEFIGGSQLYDEVGTQQNITTTGYNDLATVGPSITLPSLAGDYMIQHGAYLGQSVAAGQRTRMSFAIGATAASDAWGAFVTGTGASANGDEASVARMTRATGVAAGALIRAKYRIDVGAATPAYAGLRWISVTPIRVG